MSEEKKTWLLNTGDDLYKDCKDFFPIGIDPDLTPSDIPSAIISSIEKVTDDKFKIEITSTLRGSSEENTAAEMPLTYRVKYFLSKGDTFTLRFNDYDVDDEDLNTYYFGDDDEVDDEDDDEYVEEIDYSSEDVGEEDDFDFDEDDDVEEIFDLEDDEINEDDEIFTIDDEDDEIEDDDYFEDELDENFLFSVGLQHFKVTEIDWNTITLEYSSEDEDDFIGKE